MYDCVIVGAGPAGGAAAYHLAKRGRSVLVLEKESLPRYKPCGGGVSPQVQQWFDFDFSPAISLRLRSVRYTWNKEDPVEVELASQEPFWMVRRDIFDHFLIKQAQAQGAELRDGTEVLGIQWHSDHWKIETPNGSVEGKYLIAADGGKGKLAQHLGFKERKRRLAGALEVETPVEHQNRQIHFEFALVKNGYIWNFPKADGFSIGIGTFRGGEPQDFKAILKNYATLFDLDISQAKQYGHPISVWDGKQKLHTQNALLAGEAACVVDPFSAEGIRPSIYSGMQAGLAIDRALGGDSNALSDYSTLINEEWGNDMAWAQRLAALFYRVPHLGYKLGVKRPSATRRMGLILSGEMRYRDIADRAIKRLTAGIIPGRGGTTP